MTIRGGRVARRYGALVDLNIDEARIAQSFFPRSRGAALEHGGEAVEVQARDFLEGVDPFLTRALAVKPREKYSAMRRRLKQAADSR